MSSHIEELLSLHRLSDVPILLWQPKLGLMILGVERG